MLMPSVRQTQPCRDTAAWLFSFREAYAHTFVRESFRIAGIHYFVPKMASRLSERAALQATPLPRVTIRPHLSACVSRLSVFRLSVLEDNTDNRDNGLFLNSMLSDDNNKYNFYQPKGWLPLEIFWWGFFDGQGWLSWFARLTILACKIDYFGL